MTKLGKYLLNPHRAAHVAEYNRLNYKKSDGDIFWVPRVFNYFRILQDGENIAVTIMRLVDASA